MVTRLEKKARDLGVFDNTLFIFTSDNGTAVVAKSRGTERGCRVPFIAWGGSVKQRGATDEYDHHQDGDHGENQLVVFAKELLHSSLIP